MGEEKLRVAQEKLAKILQKKAQQRAAQQHKMGPRSRMAEPPEPAYRAGPRSRLQTLNPSMNFEQAPPLPPAPAETPAAAYRPGPRSRLQILNPTLLTNPPPPPPPPEPGVSGGPGGPPSQKNQNITEDDISSFMNQWLEQPPSSSQKTVIKLVGTKKDVVGKGGDTAKG